MSKIIKFSLLLSLISLTSCGGSNPSKNEVQNLIIKEGLPYAERQVRYYPWDAVYAQTIANGNQNAINFVENYQYQLNNIKVNDKALKKYLKNDMSVENVKCEESTEFKKFYNCSVSIKYNTKQYYYLKTYDIMFNRLDDGSIVAINTDMFSLQKVGEGERRKIGSYGYNDRNLFTTLKSDMYAPSSDAQSIYIPENDDSVIDKKVFSNLYRDAYKN